MTRPWTKLSNVTIAFVALVAVWQAVVLIWQFEESLFPPPLTVWKGIVSLVQDGTLFVHLQVSLLRFGAGYLTAVICAVALGLLLGMLPRMWAYIDPIVQVLRPVSPIAWSPFIVLWFGIGNAPAIVIIFLAAFFPVLLSTVSAVRRVEPIYLKIAQNVEMSRRSLITKIIFPASFPYIANGLHIAVGTAWIFLVSGEMVGTQSGLGFLIVDARNYLRLDLVFAGIILIGVCGLLLDKAVGWLERRIERLWGVAHKD